MPRVKRGVQTKKTHKNLLKLTKGYKYGRKSKVKRAKEAAFKAGQHAYIDRRLKKRFFRRLWITRINAACRVYGIKYSELIKKLYIKKIEIDRKILADLAMNNREEFEKIIQKIK